MRLEVAQEELVIADAIHSDPRYRGAAGLPQLRPEVKDLLISVAWRRLSHASAAAVITVGYINKPHAGLFKMSGREVGAGHFTSPL